MRSLRPRPTGPALLTAAAALCLALPGSASGQGHTPDPYNIVGEYNSQFEPYMYATYPNASGVVPNQGRLTGRSGFVGANQFQSYLEDLDGAGLDESGRFPTRSGPGNPYYRAFRRYDQEFQRTYRPNEAADKSFYSNLQQRNEKYFQAMREPDSKKRAQLLREYNLENLRAARSLSGGRNAEREAERDRFSDRSAVAPADDEPSAPPPTRRSAASPAPSRSAAGAPVGAGSGAAAPSSARSLRGPSSVIPSPASRSPSAPRSTATPSTRSELLDRASRAVAPRSTAAPPP
jgi:hypothetical protein